MLDTQNFALKRFGLALALLVWLSNSGCQPANTNVSANANSGAVNSNANANSNSESTDRGPKINTREPEKYSANLTFSLETEGGDKAIGIPSLTVQVARN